jgi:hypothetical protein
MGRMGPRPRTGGIFARGPIVEGSLSSGGQEHTSPIWLLTTAGVAGLFWFIFFVIQITGTEQAVFTFLQSTITITPQETAGQLLAMQQGSLDSTNMIASAIGWSVQLMLLVASFPTEHYTTYHIGRARRYAMILLIGTDWLTDMLYVLHHRTVFDGFLHFAPGGFGILIVALIYPIAVTAVTVFAGIEFAHRIDKLISLVRGL